VSAAVVDLLLQVTVMPNAADPSTWLIRGRPPTAEELSILAQRTSQDIEDYGALVHLWIELKAADS
jgi:hypothetical protein